MSDFVVVFHTLTGEFAVLSTVPEVYQQNGGLRGSVRWNRRLEVATPGINFYALVANAIS